MSNSLDTVFGEIADYEQFFAPASSDMVDGLVGQYQSVRNRVEQFAAQFEGDDLAPIIGYFFDGNMDRSWHRIPDLSKTFKADGAIAALNSEYWQRALNLTDVYDAMPQKRRDEWNEWVRENKCPDFEEETVRATLEDLLVSRAKFFAERVDGIFRALSREHVTNCPEGFRKRMILYVFDNIGLTHTSNMGHLTDLRKIIARFMGRDEPHYSSTDQIAKACGRNTGQWVTIDAGAMRMKVFKKGTAHLEVHPDMAWRLNAILSQLYPNAIPSSFRTKPKRKAKSFELMDRPLPFEVIGLLGSLEQAVEPTGEIGGWNTRYRRVPDCARFRGAHHVDNAIRREAEKVLEAIGGVRTDRNDHQFDYDYQPVLDEILTSGCVPHQQSHQFYPTPGELALEAVKLAEIGPGDQCLEPSAGTGGIAAHMPLDRTQCVEVSKLHCSVLEAKGFSTINADFLAWTEKMPHLKFSRIVMNPPYSQGRWKHHTEAASRMLGKAGRLVAILPASAKNKFDLDGFDCSYSRVYENQFSGTSTAVVFLIAIRC